MAECDFVIKDLRIPLGPSASCEEMVLDYIRDTMGEGREEAAIREWNLHSRTFTIPENTNHYSLEDFYKARAKYVCFAFDEDRKIWP